jgi:hypothetical protein
VALFQRFLEDLDLKRLAPELTLKFSDAAFKRNRSSMTGSSPKAHSAITPPPTNGRLTRYPSNKQGYKRQHENHPDASYSSCKSFLKSKAVSNIPLNRFTQ